MTEPLHRSNDHPGLWRRFLAGKLGRDIGWNLISLIFIGSSGILINVLIARFYDPAALGVFNQVYAIYVFASQLAAAGLPPSTLKHVAEYAEEERTCREIILSATVLASVLAAAGAGIFFWLRVPLGRLLSSPGVASGMAWAAPGLFFFALNKVLLSALNGYRRMGHFAFLQSLRALLMLGSLIVLAKIQWPANQLAVVFTFSESILFLFCVSFLFRSFCVSLRVALGHWGSRHLIFGAKSFLSGMFLELNMRADILMLGYFSSDTVVGVYSFVAMLAGGLRQVLAVATRNVTPILVPLIVEGRVEELKNFIRKGSRVTFLSMLGLGGAVAASFPIWMVWIVKGPEYRAAWPLFIILVVGIVGASGYIPFRDILLAAGYPGWHTIMIAILLGLNVIGNAILIPMWQDLGAAVATALTMIFLVLLLKNLAFWKLQIRL